MKSRRIDDEDKLRKAWMINRDLNHTIESAKSTQQSMLQNISQSYVYDEVAEAKRVLLTQLTGEIELLEERRLVVETEMNLALRLVTKIEDVVY